jgi:hypothetical protein
MSVEEPEAPPRGPGAGGDEHAVLVADLARLRRGHGLNTPDLPGLIAELVLLPTVCGLRAGMSDAARRDLLVGRLDAAIQRLPAEFQLALQAALALPPADQSRFLKDRLRWLGEQLQRDPRTALRRVDDGQRLLAERLLGTTGAGEPDPNDYAPDGWFVNRLRSVVMLHVDPVQLLEQRLVTSTKEGLRALTVSWSVPDEVPDAGPAPQVELLFGGDLRQDVEKSTPTYWTGSILLAEPLAPGQSHEYQLRVSALPPDRMRPYYVLTPFRRFDEFVLRAKFHPERRPEVVWRLDGVPFQTLDNKEPSDGVVSLDRSNEVEATFRNLKGGLSYGLQWRRPPPAV